MSPEASSYDLGRVFPRYEERNPSVPVWCITPDLNGCFHRFHSSSCISPSGRYVGLTKISVEDRPPKPGEPAEVVVVDLKTGEQRIVGTTQAWDAQLGAQVQWGATDAELFFNDMDVDSWKPYGVKMDFSTGEKMRLSGTVYEVSRDGLYSVSTCLKRIGRSQAGYGVIVPEEQIPKNVGAPVDDGVYVTDNRTGECRMIASYQKIIEQAEPKIDMSRYGAPGNYYGFHVKWNATGERLLLVLRYEDERGRFHPQLLTMTREGEDIRVAVSAKEWADKGGNHPAWHPDGEHILMNLCLYEKDWLYVQAAYDGSDLTPMTERIANRGHPTLHPNGRYLISDCYTAEVDAPGDGTVPLFLIDRVTHERKSLVFLDTLTKSFRATDNLAPGTMRVDLHPSWDRKTHTHVVMNGVFNGTRKVFIADLSSVLSS